MLQRHPPVISGKPANTVCVCVLGGGGEQALAAIETGVNWEKKPGGECKQGRRSRL